MCFCFFSLIIVKFTCTGIYIHSHRVVPDDYSLAQTIEITPNVVLWKSDVLLNHKIFSKILLWFYCVQFTRVLITSHPLKTFRITPNFCMGWNCKFVRHLWWYSIFHERIAGPVFMLLTIGIFHFVKNYIQGPFAENVTALIKMWRCKDLKHFIAFGWNK